MFRLVERRALYFTFSGIILLIGLGTLIYSTADTGQPLQLGIDFTGGTIFELQFTEAVGEEDIRAVMTDSGFEEMVVQELNPLDTTAIEDVEAYPEGSRWEASIAITAEDVEQEPDGILENLSSEIVAIDTEASTARQTDTTYELDIQFTEVVDEATINETLMGLEIGDVTLQSLPPVGGQAYSEGSRWSVRTEEADATTISLTLERLSEDLAPLDDDATSTNEVSGAVGEEVTRAALYATVAAAFVVFMFMYFAFRSVPNAFRYGACAIAAMLHDLMIMLTAMSIFGLLLGWQADALFLTSILTVLGFSVQDTIVVFDRIRENIPRRRGESYELIVNRSVLETIHRSFATQLNAVFIMVSLVLFGGETTRQFIIIMLIGLSSGTYSSIFIAVPLLVSWELGQIPFLNREAKQLRNAQA